MELILPPSRRRGRNRREENRKISGSPPGEPSPASFPPVELHGPRLAGDSSGKAVKDGNRTAIRVRGGLLVYVGAALTGTKVGPPDEESGGSVCVESLDTSDRVTRRRLS